MSNRKLWVGCYIIIGILWGMLYAQEQTIDSRIWSISYWQKLASQGLVEVAPSQPVPAALHTGKKTGIPGVSFQNNTDIAITSDPNTTQSENSVFVHPLNVNKALNSNNSTTNPVSLLYGADYWMTADGGASWNGSVEGAGGFNSGDPAAAIDLNGHYYVGYITNSFGMGVARSTNEGQTWTAATVHFSSNDDKNHLWVDNTPSSPYAGNLYDAWTDFNFSDIVFSRSTDGGVNWSPAINISSAVASGSHDQGVNVQTGPNGEVYAVWAIYDNWPVDENAIGFAKSTDGGATFAPATRIITNIRGIRISETSKNHRVNSFPVMAVDVSNGPRQGTIYVVWSNIGVPGINNGPDIDIYMIKSTDGGDTWSTPTRVNQDPAGLGKQHYFPWITCDPVTGAISVISYDDRNVSSTQAETWTANSADGGLNWFELQVSDVAFTPSPIPGLAGGYFGDYLGISARGGKVYPVWTDNRTGAALAYTSPFFLEEDSIAPAPITNVAVVNSASNSVTLSWTATGDDGLNGAASSYDIRYSSAGPINEGNFDLATEVSNPPFPQPSGSTETFAVTGLNFNTAYWFALKAFDEFGNSSGVSNSPSATTLGVPDIAINPDSLSADLLTGETETQTLTISNVSTVPSTLDFFLPQFGGEASLRLTEVNGDRLSFQVLLKDRQKALQRPLERQSGKNHLLPKGQANSYPLLNRILNTVTAQNTIFYDDMESGVNGWTTALYGGAPDDLWHQTNIAFNSPITSWWCGIEGLGTYATGNRINTAVISPPINLSIVAAPITLEFFESYETEAGWDFCMVDVTTDGGANWIPLRGLPGQAPSGSSGGWIMTVLDLSAFAGETIQIRFYFDTGDGAFNDFPGWFFDDALVTAAGFSFLSVTPAQGSISMGQSVDLAVTFDAFGMFGGDYDAEIEILSNDPDESQLFVPAHLHVTGAPDIAVSADLLDFGNVFVGYPDSLTLIVSNAGTDLLTVSNITSNNPDYTVGITAFNLNPGEDQAVPVVFTPSAAGPSSATLTIFSNDADEFEYPVALQGVGLIPPDIAVTPASLSDSLFTGETSTHILTISNNGLSDLNFEIAIEEALASAVSVKVRPSPRISPLRQKTSGKSLQAAERSEKPYSFGRSPSRGRIYPEMQKKASVANGLSILLLAGGGDPSEIQSLLLSFPDIEVVDIYDALGPVPALNDLLAYQSVILLNDNPFPDPVGLGNVLADYVDAGGGLIVTIASFASGWEIQGRIATDGYLPFDIGFGPVGGASLGNFDPTHPIMEGVVSVFGDLLVDTGVASGGELIAEYTNGFPFVATKGTVAGINIFIAGSGFWSGDVPLVLHNAAFWSSGGGPLSWLSVAPENGTVPAGSSLDIMVTFDAAGLFGGDYNADIVISSNDPATPEVAVPAHLHVIGAPDIAVSADLLDFGNAFVGYPDSLTLIVSNEGTDLLTVSNIASNNPDYSVGVTAFNLNPGEDQAVPVIFTPSATGPSSGILTIFSNDVDEFEYPVALQGVGLIAPDIAVTPDSLSDSLFTGETSTHTLTIDNSGGSDLNFSISFEGTDAASVKVRSYFKNQSPAQTLLASYPSGVSGNSFSSGHSPVRPMLTESRIPPEALSSAGIKILLLFDGACSDISEIQGLLSAFPDVESVDFWDANIVPALNDLLAYDAVILGDNCAFSDPVGLGNVLADYVDAGGGLTITVAAFFGGWEVMGRLADEEYIPFNLGFVTGAASLGSFDPTHPIMEGVQSAEGFLIVSDATVASGAEEIAAWNIGTPFVATKGTVAAVNIFVAAAGFWTGDIPLILHNAALWTSGEVGFVSADPTSGTIPAGASLDITVTFDAFGLNGGDYNANLIVSSNDPDEPQVSVPAHLHVTGAPDIAVSADLLDFGNAFVGYPDSLTLVVSNEGTDLLTVSNITSNHPDYSVGITAFNLNPGEDQAVPVIFTPSAAGPSSAMLTIFSNDVDEFEYPVALQGVGLIPPDIAVTPDSLSDSLFTGEMSTHILTIDNSTGGSDLVFDISVQNLSADAVNVNVSSKRSQTHLNRKVPPLNKITGTLFGGNSQDPHPGEQALPFNSIESAGDSSILVIQDFFPWGVDMFSFILNNFGIFSTVINSGQISATDFSLFDIVITVGDQGFDYYNAISSNVSKFEDFVASGGIVQYQLATQGDNVSLVNGVNVIFGNIENFNQVLLPDHPIVAGLPGLLEGNAANHCYLTNLPPDAAIITETQSSLAPTTVEYPFGSGTVIATGMTWEFLYINGYNAGPMLYNAVAYSLSLSGAQWASVDPGSGVVPAGSSLDVTVTFDATGLNGGDYNANIIVSSNDPDEPEVTVPAHLHVTGAPDIVVSADLLDFGNAFVGYPDSLTLVVSNEGTDLLAVSDITFNNPDYTAGIAAFNLNPGEEQAVPVIFTPSAAGPSSGTLTIASNDPDEPAYPVSLQGVGLIPPDIAVTPDSLSDSLFTGETSTHTLTINNTGGSDLTFEIRLEEVSALTSVEAANTSVAKFNPFANGPSTSIYPAHQSGTRGASRKNSGKNALPNHINSMGSGITNVLILSNEQFDMDWIAVNFAANMTDVVFSTFDVIFNVPDLAYLQTFDVVLLFENATFANSTAVGDRLYEFVLSGGNLVIGTFYWQGRSDGGFGVSWGNLELIDPVFGGSCRYQSESLGVILNHPLTEGVTSLTTFFRGGPVLLRNDATAVAWWAGGDIFLAFNRPGGTITAVTTFPAEPNYQAVSGDFFLVWENALKWTASGAVSWLEAEPLSGMVAAGSSIDVTITFDATELNGGDYDAHIIISSNDPDELTVNVPAHLHVTGAANIAVTPDSLVFDTVFVGFSDFDTLKIMNSGTDTLVVSNITASDTVFSVDRTSLKVAPQAEDFVLVTFAPLAAGLATAQLTIASNDPNHGLLNVPLRGTGIFPPSVFVNPDSISAEVLEGDSTTRPLTIGNNGAGALHWSIQATKRNTLAVSSALIQQLTQRFQALGATDIQWNGPEVSYRLQGEITVDGNTESYEFFNTITVTNQLEDIHVLFTGADWSILQVELEARGAQTTVHTGPITPASLDDANVLVINDETDPTTNEINYIRDWMNNGGGLIIDADNDIAEYNAIMNGSGITYLPTGGISGVTTNITPHPVTQNINAYLIALGGDAAASLSVSGGALDVIRQMNSVPHVAVSGLGRGLMVAVADESINNAFIARVGHLNLALNSVSWLAIPNWIAVSPAAGTVLPGDSAEVTVTLNAAELTAGLYEAFLRIVSDDPYNAAINVPVRLDVQPVGIEDPYASNIPVKYELMQNYPNPFNPETQIRFGLPKISKVKLELFNILGQRVLKLIDEQMPAGYHVITLDGRDLASGMYFYRIQAEEFTDQRKMILIK